MGNKSTFTAQLRIEAIVADAQKELTNFGNSLKHAWQGGEPPKSLMRTYEEMRVRLESLKQISEKGLVDTSDLRQAENDFKAFQKDIHNLTVEFKLMSTEQKRAMLSTEEQTAMKARTAAVKEYTDAIKKNQDILKQRKPLEEQRATVIKEQEPARNKAQATLDVSGPALKAIEKRGALLSKEAEIYKNNVEWAAKYEEKIKRLQKKPNKTESDNKSIAKAQADLDALDLKTGKEQYDREMALYNAEVQRLRDSVEAATEEMGEMDSAIRKLDGQLAKLNPVDETEQLNKLKERLKELGVEGIDDAKDIDTLRKAIQQLDDKAFARVEQSLKDMNVGLSAMGAEALQVGKEIDASTEAIERQNGALRNQEAFEGRIKQFLGMTGAVELLRRSMISAFNTIKDLDAAMTEMAVVTDIDISGYWDQLPEYTARANELGLTIKDVYQADTLFYQQGLKTNEVVELSTQTMRMARVAGLDTAEATDRMTAALRGFNMELNEANAQKIADVYSELAAITASDVDEISSAMTKTASIAASAGMEFETTAAFLSQIIETTRESAETAGTALKTVIARFQELKKDPSEIGEVEGEIVDANKIETALRSVGVALRDSSGQFRELDDVFLELAQKWDSLDTNTQRYIATIAAGSRQQSRFIAMMSDYGRTQELVSAATNSAGANQEQFEKTMESLSAKLNELKNAWNEFSMGILESDLVKAGVDILTTFLKVINKATSAFDGLGGSIMKIVTVIGMFNMAKKIFAKIKEPIIDVFSQIVAEAYKKGGDAAEAMHKGAKDRAEQISKEENGKPSSGKDEDAPKEKRTFGQWAKDTSGIAKLGAVKRYNKAIKITDEKNLDNLLAKQADRKATGWGPKGGKRRGEEAEKARKEYESVTNEIEEYEAATKDAAKNAESAWKEVGQGIAQMGGLVAGAGIGISMLSASLEEMGVEGTEWLTWLGNGVTMLGSAVSGLGPVVTSIVGKLVDGGMTSAAAWGWVIAVVAAVAALTIAVVGIVKAVENASPEKKLENARKEADKAAEAADNAQKAYEGMRDSLESIGEAQKKLEGLTNNTDAWRTAVSNLNAEILELIQQYPQLAKFVEHENGVMTIDFESEGVQKALDDAQKIAQNAQLIATGAQIGVFEAQNAAAYDRLDNKAKIEYIDPETAAGAASAGVYASMMGAGAAGLGVAGGAIGTAVPVIGNAIGAVAGAAIGAAAGAITASTTGAADAAADAAAEAAEAYNDKTQATVEGVARALASGEIYDTGSGYKMAQGVSEADLYAKYGIEAEGLDKFYNSLKDAEPELREFGKGLNETTAQMQAYYDSMTTQIYNMLDTTGWDEDTTTIADNIVSGEAMEQRRNVILEGLEDTNMLDKNLDDDIRKRMESAIESTYGAGAQLVEDKENGGYKIIDSKGETQLVNVTSEALKNIVATQEAKNEQMDVGNMMPDIKETLIEAFQTKGALADLDDSAVEKAIIAAFDNENGKSLTSAQVEMLNKLTDKELEDIFDSSDELKKAFVTSGNFISKLRTPVKQAEEAFKQSAEVFNQMSQDAQNALSGLSSGAKEGLADESRMGMVYNMGTEEEIAAFEKALTTALSGENADEVASYLSTINWADSDALTKAQYVLMHSYDLSKEAADNLVVSIGNATDAVSYSATVVDKFDALYQSELKLASISERLTALQERYNRALSNSAANSEQLLKELIEGYEAEGLEHQAGYSASLQRISSKYGEGIDKYGEIFSKYVKLGKNGIDWSQTDLEALAAATGDREGVYAIVDNIENYYKTANSHYKGMHEALKAIEEAEQQGEDAYLELRNMVKETMLDKLQKQIDLEQATLDATEEANDKLLSKMQEQIDDARQARDNEKTEQNIADLEAQRAYLMAAGGNATEIAALDKQIAESKESYQDSLIDQELAKIQDANEKAAEQRQQQIDIARLQLDEYTKSAAFQNEIDKNVQTIADAGENWSATTIGQAMAEKFTVGMGEWEQGVWASNVSSKVTSFSDWQTGTTEGTFNAAKKEIIEAITNADEGEEGVLEKEGVEKAIAKKRQKLEAMDVSTDITAKMGMDALSAAETFIGKENSTNISGLQNKLDSINAEYMTRKEYYSSMSDAFTTNNGKGLENAVTYEKYLQTKWEDTSDYLQDQKETYVTSALLSLKNPDANGWNNEHFLQAKEAFLEIGTEGEWEDLLSSYLQDQEFLSNNGLDSFVENNGTVISGTIPGAYATLNPITRKLTIVVGDTKILGLTGDYTNDPTDQLNKTLYNGLSPDEGWVALWDDCPVVYWGDRWIRLSSDDNDYDSVKKALKESLNPGKTFKTGGLADFTGPAWLDGTKSHPELVLNARDTENFIQLKDILAHVMDRTGSTTNNTSSGDNYYEIEINVDSIEGDYDVEQMADKIRDMIYRDATYRNVNAVNQKK